MKTRRPIVGQTGSLRNGCQPVLPSVLGRFFSVQPNSSLDPTFAIVQ